MSNTTFTDNKKVKHIEIGAGCGNFGKKFYNECYLTDIDSSLMTSCKSCQIDIFCNAYNLPWGDNRFDRIIMCNPYGFGFNDTTSSELLLNELIRVSKKSCEIIIVCHTNNKYCAPERVRLRVGSFIQEGISLDIYSENNIDSTVEYAGYIFRSSGGVETKPNKRLVINVSK